MSAIVVKDGLVHYEAIGRGKPLVFIHGWLGSWRYWVPAMEEMSVRYRTYALDLWGFGDSDKVNVHYTVDSYVEQLAEFLDQLGVGPVPLVGHALGGVVALLFAANYPDRVKQVMAVSVPLVGGDISRPLASFAGNGNALSRLISRRADFPEVSMEANKTDSDAIRSSLRSVLRHDMRRVLYPLEMPVLLVYGKSDSLVKVPQVSWLDDLRENVRPIFLEEAQHFPMLEERNKFNRLLMEFLEREGDVNSIELKEEWQRRMR